jgi:O-methyltransferase
MVGFIIKGVKYLFGKFLYAKHYVLSNSMLANQMPNDIDLNYMDYVRLSSLVLYAQEIKSRKIPGAIAELGVYKGKFARYINQHLPESKFYLFDTFEGFDQKDIAVEQSNSYSDGTQDFTNTSVTEVLNRMPKKEMCIVKQGFFPGTAEDLEETFSLVSIDTDLYEPIYQGLVYFYPRLSKGGYIMVHDYNNKDYPGAKDAVRKYCSENGISFTPIPDAMGSAIITK